MNIFMNFYELKFLKIHIFPDCQISKGLLKLGFKASRVP